MKRLDKPTKHKRDNLLNFKKKTDVSLNLLSNGKLSEYLNGKNVFFWSHVSGFNQPKLLESQAFHVHLKLAQKITVEGEVT
jgi:hypothetical protein